MSSSPLYLSTLCVLVLLAQFVSPLAGLLSDRLRTDWGRRRPFIIFGTVLSTFGLYAMQSSSAHGQAVSYAVALLMAQVGLSVVQAAQCSIIPDLCDPIQFGVSSGIAGCLQFGGNIAGMIFVLVMGNSVNVIYLFFQLLLVCACVVTCVVVQERPLTLPWRPLTAKMVLSAYSVNPAAELDFCWVLAGRLFFFVSASMQTFSYFYLRDVVAVPSEQHLRWYVAEFSLGATVAAFFTSVPMSQLSDRRGRKVLVYASCVALAVVNLAYIVAPLVVDTIRLLDIVRLLSFLHGIATSTYISVDYALVLDCLPFGRGIGEALGLWHTAGFLGTAAGPLVGGLLLSWHRGVVCSGCTPPVGYAFEGYAALLSVGAHSALAVALLSYPITNAK